MKFSGFTNAATDSQYILSIDFPEQLKAVFFARLYGKGSVCEGRNGEQDKIWQDLSYNYNSMQLVAPKQVHGVNIIPAVKQHALPLREEADGVFIDKSSDCLGSLRFADCTPLVMASSEPAPWLLLLHSGFVGTMKNIAAAGLAYAAKRFCRRIPADGVWAWIGPGICGKCYSRKTAGDAITDRALIIFSQENYVKAGEYCFFDIHGQIRRQLLDIGVSPAQTFSCDSCTNCGGEPLYSYRRGDKNNRIFLLAGNATN